jgi:hypothetical protein
LKVEGVKLRIFEDQGRYFKMAGSSGGSCEVSSNIYLEREDSMTIKSISIL